MTARNLFIFSCLLCGMMVSCSDPEHTSLDVLGIIGGSSEGVDIRFSESETYNQSHGFATIQAPAETYYVYACSDSHVISKRTRWEQFIRAYRADTLCPVALHLGDLISAQNHFDFMKNALTDIPRNPLKKDTLMAAIGNHDIYFGQWTKFRELWHTSTYYFIVQTPRGAKDLFIILDSAEGILGPKQTAWFQSILPWADTQSFRHVVVCSHTHLFKEDTSQQICSNYPLEETYALINLLTSHHVDMYWSGHVHYRSVDYVKNMVSVVLDAIDEKVEHPTYMQAILSDDEINYQFIAL